MKIRILLLISVCLFQASYFSIAVATTQEKKDDIRLLVVLMGNDKIGEQMAEMMVMGILNQMKQKYPKITKEAENAISRAINKVIKEESSRLTDRFSPLYDKHFTHSEIKELIKFYGSPVGQKFTANFQSLTIETMQAGQEWAVEIQPKLQQALEKELQGVTIE